jgi:hypothetical protein
LVEKKVGLGYILVMQKKTVGRGKLLTIVIMLGVVVAISIYQKQVVGKKPIADTKAVEAVKTVSKYMELPNEAPTVATVTDKSKLAPEAFFEKAENDDMVLIFSQASKAILYRPATKKIIDVSNLSITGGEENLGINSTMVLTPTAEIEKEKKEISEVKLALYNGSKEIGLATTTERDIFGQIDYFSVVSKRDAKRNDYEKTLVIDISGKYAELAKSLAEDLSAEIGALPSGEVKPAADILIILGKVHP